jgi:hypothetical protein
MFNKINNNVSLKFAFFSSVLILFLMISLLPTSAADNGSVGPKIIKDAHIIQLIQMEESPSVIRVIETLTYNNTGDETFNGTLLLRAIDPMFVQVFIGTNTIPIRPPKIDDDLFAFDLPENYSIEPNEPFEITVETAVSFPQNSPNIMIYEKKIEYDTDLIMLVIWPLGGYEVQGGGIELTKATSESFAGAYVSPHSSLVPAYKGDLYTITFKEIEVEKQSVETSDSSDEMIYIFAVLIVIGLGLVLHLILRRRRKGEAPKDIRSGVPAGKTGTAAVTKVGSVTKSTTKKPEGAVKDSDGENRLDRKRQKLIDEKKKILLSKKQLKSDYKSNTISKDVFNEMDNKYQTKLKEINKDISKLDRQIEKTGALPGVGAQAVSKGAVKGEEKKLLERKKTLLSVIKNLEKRHEAGELPDEVFDEMKSEYKQEAIEVLKKLDDINRDRND